MPIPINPAASQRITQYIARQRPFAQAILKKLRQIIHTADPKIQEDWKWGPNFAHHGMVVGIVGFQKWASIWFFNGAAMRDGKKLFNDGLDNQRNRQIKFANVAEVKKHEKDLIVYIQEAVRHNVTGMKPAAPRRRTAKPMPADIKQSLARRRLQKQYAARPPYQQRDYLSWITSAKQAPTRTKRLEQMLEELEDGDQYMGMRYRNPKSQAPNPKQIPTHK